MMRRSLAHRGNSVDAFRTRWLPESVRIDGLQLVELDPIQVDDRDAGQLADVANAAAAVDAPPLPTIDAAYVRSRLAYGHDMTPATALSVARSADDEIVAVGELHRSRWDNAHVAILEIQTAPAHRGRGIGDSLLARLEQRARALGCTELLAEAWVGSPGEAFWQRHGFTVGSIAANRRLWTGQLDTSGLHKLLAEAEDASAGYDLIELPNPAPEELVPQLLALHLAMNDSPLDDLRLDDDEWPVERLRAYEDAMRQRGMRLHRLVAQRRSDGVLGGHTVVAVDEERPMLGMQEDTAVVAGHRGHRLGLRLKIAMLELLGRKEPQLHFIDTWNAESNRHMIQINDALGCVVVGRGVEVQRPA